MRRLGIVSIRASLRDSVRASLLTAMVASTACTQPNPTTTAPIAPKPIDIPRLASDAGSPSGVTPPIPNTAKDEVHVFGIYEAVSGHSGNRHPRAKATFTVTRRAPQTLVLSAYEPIDWRVVVREGAQLHRVIVTGFHPQKVEIEGATNIDIQNYSGDFKYLSSDGSPGDGSLDGAPALVAATETLLGRPVDSYTGCYQANAALQKEDGTITAPCDQDDESSHPKTPKLSALRAQLHPLARSFYEFRTKMLARCGSWDVTTCTNRGAVILLERAARAAGVTLEGHDPKRVLPILVPANQPITLIRASGRQVLTPEPGALLRIRDASAQVDRLSGPRTVDMRGPAADRFASTIGGSVCTGGVCAFSRSPRELAFLMEWLTTLDGVDGADGLREIALR